MSKCPLFCERFPKALELAEFVCSKPWVVLSQMDSAGSVWWLAPRNGVGFFTAGKQWYEEMSCIIPWKINGWKLQSTHLERKMIFQTSMIMFHVNLPGCTNFLSFRPFVCLQFQFRPKDCLYLQLSNIFPELCCNHQQTRSSAIRYQVFCIKQDHTQSFWCSIDPFSSNPR